MILSFIFAASLTGHGSKWDLSRQLFHRHERNIPMCEFYRETMPGPNQPPTANFCALAAYALDIDSWDCIPRSIVPAYVFMAAEYCLFIYPNERKK